MNSLFRSWNNGVRCMSFCILMWPTWVLSDPDGILAPWTLLSGISWNVLWHVECSAVITRFLIQKHRILAVLWGQDMECLHRVKNPTWISCCVTCIAAMLCYIETYYNGSADCIACPSWISWPGFCLRSTWSKAVEWWMPCMMNVLDGECVTDRWLYRNISRVSCQKGPICQA